MREQKEEEEDEEGIMRKTVITITAAKHMHSVGPPCPGCCCSRPFAHTVDKLHRLFFSLLL